MRIVIVLLAISLLVGCATASKIYLPSGEQGYSVTCSGAALTWGHCFEKAGELCGAKGYTVITRSDEQGSVVGGGQYGVYGGSTINRNMLIRCNETK